MTIKNDNLSVPFYKTHKLNPENQETPLRFLRQWITPEEYFFIRNHFSYPEVDERNYSVGIDGAVYNPSRFLVDQLKVMPTREFVISLECSGNKRAFFDPKVYGIQWEEGAMSQGLWKGVPFKILLEHTGIKDSAKEVVFEGHDHGTRKDIPGEFLFARSLPMSIALHPDTIIAYELNGKPIPYKHGFPLRLIVPSWYGMAWVKWLKRITVITRKFSGPFQTIDYIYYPDKNSDRGKHPVNFKNVNSTILYPHHLAAIDKVTHRIEGIAWTGKGIITEVEISMDNGIEWHKAALSRYPYQPFAWIYWWHSWSPPHKGEYTILSRAKDSSGRIQPLEPYWNRKGYGYNAVSQIKVQVE